MLTRLSPIKYFTFFNGLRVFISIKILIKTMLCLGFRLNHMLGQTRLISVQGCQISETLLRNYVQNIHKGSPTNDVTQFLTLPPFPFVTHFTTKAFYCRHKIIDALPPLRLWRHLWTTPNLKTMIIILGTQKKTEEEEERRISMLQYFTSTKLSKEKERKRTPWLWICKTSIPTRNPSDIHQYILNRENKIMYKRNAIFYLWQCKLRYCTDVVVTILK